MSTVAEPSKPGATAKEDPFRYGWRFVQQVLPDGTRTFKQVPLTLEDLLHPQEEDFQVVSDEHNEDCAYLKYALKKHLPSDMVLSDHRVAWDEAGEYAHGPDVAVFPAKGERTKPGGTYNVVAEGVPPVLIIEIVSPDSRVNDVNHKFKEYYETGVACYIIVDTQYRQGRRVRAQLYGYQHTPTGYELLQADERGWLWLEPLELWLGIDGVQARLYDAQGNKIPDYLAVSKALEAAQERVRELEERLRRVEAQTPTPTNPPNGATGDKS